MQDLMIPVTQLNYAYKEIYKKRYVLSLDDKFTLPQVGLPQEISLPLFRSFLATGEKKLQKYLINY